MAEDATRSSSTDRNDEFLQVWTDSAAYVLGQVVGRTFAFQPNNTEPPGLEPASDNDFHCTIAIAGRLRGEMSLRTSRAVVIAVAQLFLGEPANASVEFNNDHQDAFEEFLRQVAGQVATSLKPHWGEVQLSFEKGTPSWSPASTSWLTAEGSAPNLWLHEQMSPALQAALASELQTKDAAVANAPDTAIAVSMKDSNLGLLLDVELDVTLRFGAKNMLLREILELGTGAVVELDRRIDEPADLFLDGRLIARGEVVVVDGNYGLRVLEVNLPQSTDSASEKMRA